MPHTAISRALQDMDPEAFLRALQVATIEALDPAKKPRYSTVMKILDALSIKLQVVPPSPPGARWVADIGSRGRLTLPQALLDETGLHPGDTLLFEEEVGNQLKVRRVV